MMKCILIIVVSFFVWSNVNAAYRNFPDNWFNQTLDHFDPINNQTFKERYWFNDEYFNQTHGSVVFLFLTGEDQLYSGWMTNGTWISYAKHFNALAVALEHRYYGASAPFKNFTTENLKFLTTPQALVDIANFVANVKIPNNTFLHDPQWIIYAGSYAGQLAAWSRQKYPHLIKGVVVSSSPFKAKLIIPEYMDTVADDIKKTSKTCYDTIGEGFAEVEKLLQTTEGRANLSKELNLCTPLNTTAGKYEDQDLVVELQIDYQTIAQISSVNRLSYRSEEVRKNFSLNHICSIVTDNSTKKSSLARIHAVADFLRQGSCLDYGYEKYVKSLQDTLNTDRLWWWQKCTEYPYIQLQNNNGSSKIFGSIVEAGYYIDQCTALFGDWLNRARLQIGVYKIQLGFGDVRLNITNSVFLYGTFDPWHKLGLLESNNKNSPVIIINGTSHAADMFPAADDDPQELTNARKTVRDLIASWLNE